MCEIIGVVLRIQSYEFTLNLKEARTLRDTLNEFLDESQQMFYLKDASRIWIEPQLVYLNSG